jgi:hypothetical protein
MVRQVLILGVGFAAALGLLAAPGEVHAQHGRGGFHHASFGSRAFSPTFGRGSSFHFEHFDRGFDRRFGFGNSRVVGDFGSFGVAPGFFSPTFASGFSPRFFTPGFGGRFVSPVFFTSPTGFTQPIFIPGP